VLTVNAEVTVELPDGVTEVGFREQLEALSPGTTQTNDTGVV
jgi:hypothetical protein